MTKMATLFLLGVTVVLGLAFGEFVFSLMEAGPPISAVSLIGAKYLSHNATLIIEARNIGARADSITAIDIAGFQSISGPRAIDPSSGMIYGNKDTVTLRYDLSSSNLLLTPGQSFTFAVRLDSGPILPGIARVE